MNDTFKAILAVLTTVPALAWNVMAIHSVRKYYLENQNTIKNKAEKTVDQVREKAEKIKEEVEENVKKKLYDKNKH
jgi:hypothetical protein